MVALQVLATQGSTFGWSSPATLGLLAITVVFGVVFLRAESGNPDAFVDFKLFGNMVYTGATLSNLLLNGVAGILALARYYASLPAPCRRRTLVLLFASAHDTLVADGTNRFAERLDPEYDQGTVAFAFALEHFGAREILPMPDGDGSGRRLEFTGKGDPFLFAAGDGAALRQAAVEATQRRNLDRTAVMPGLAGASRMAYRRFLFFNVIGGVMWGSACVLLGYFAAHSISTITHALGVTSGVIVVASALVR